jgi:hypothetical protein
MLEVKNALEQVVIHPRWTEYVQSLFNRQNGNRAHALASSVRATVLEGNFWHRCQNYVHMVEDVLKALRVFDGQEAAMGRAWLTMNNLKKHIFNLRNPPFNLPVRIATTLEENFTKRWDMMLMDLHYACALLNPYLKDVLEIQENGDAKHAFNRVVRKLCAILGVGFNDAMAELTKYEERRGPYNPMEAPDIREAHMEPHQWWHRVGGNALPKIAKRILSLTCSTSSCERNWSKSRNRLGELGLTKPRHWYTSIPIRSSSTRDQGQIQCVGTITTSSPRIQTPTTKGTKQRAREMMTVAMIMMVSSGHSGPNSRSK